MYDSIIFTDTTENFRVSIPLGAFKIASTLRKHGYSCLVVNHLWKYTEDELKELLSTVLSDKTKFIGFSSTFLNKVLKSKDKLITKFEHIGIESVFPQGKEFENKIFSICRSINPAVKFIVGGSKVTQNYSNKNINYVFIGYSESAIINFMDHLSNGAELNFSIKNIHGVTIIDDRTATGYDFVNDSMIWEDTDVVNHKVVPVEIGRGCIFKCKFCGYPMNGKKKLDYIKDMSVLRAELLNSYEKFGITHFWIVDDTFNDTIEKLTVMEDMVKTLPFKPYFWAYIRLDLLITRPKTVEMLYNIGIRAMFFGIETLHNKAGRSVGKGYNPLKQIEAINSIREQYPEITLHGSFIMGLPGESREDVLNSHKMLMEGKLKLNSWYFRPLAITKKFAVTFYSEFDLNYKSYGYEEIDDSEPFNINWRNEHFTWKEVNELTNELTAKSVKADTFYIAGHDIFSIVSLNYKVEDLINVKYKDFNWKRISLIELPNFIEIYKKTLLQLVKDRNKCG